MNRCENYRSAGYDRTGERAVECNALAVIECENCGHLCAECFEGSSCCSEGHYAVTKGMNADGGPRLPHNGLVEGTACRATAPIPANASPSDAPATR